MSLVRQFGVRRALLIGAALAAVLYVVGADVLHCVLLGVVAVVLALLPAALDPVEEAGDPDPLPIPYGTTLLRSINLTDPRSDDPVGEAAGLRAYRVFQRVHADHPDDPVLARFAAPPRDRWRFLPQRDLVALLDRADALDTRPGPHVQETR